MCSIAGIVGGTGALKMLAVQVHRAPDESGVYKDKKNNLELGMGRLKIIDLKSPGLSPYQEDGLVLCYNGEIYNYIELKKELKTKGWKFHTTSDTEVLMKSWREWGVKMFDKLNGMFAFAIFDPKTKKLILGRDIAGEKPLYYYHRGNKFVFSSEAKALPEVLNLQKRQDEFFEAFQHCFVTTLWKDVLELPPAHYLEYDVAKNTKKIVEYWKFTPRKINLKTAQDELESLLEDSVKLRFRSDVPVGIYYSGGIDSSLIDTFHTFDYKFYFDNTKSKMEKEFFSKIPTVLHHLDFPVGSFGFFGMWKLAEEASKKVRVIISGEGADEIFGGYVRYVPIAREYELRKKFPSYNYLFGKYFQDDYLTAYAKMTARNGNVDFVKEKLRPYFEMFPDPVNAMGFADFKLIFPSLMQMGDRMAGAFGIENRCPFLDRRLIEFGFSLPPEYKIDTLEPKVLLRRIAEKRGLVEPLKMEKRGMSVLYNKWKGIPGWDRSHYFEFLKSTWQKNHHHKKTRKSS